MRSQIDSLDPRLNQPAECSCLALFSGAENPISRIRDGLTVGQDGLLAFVLSIVHEQVCEPSPVWFDVWIYT